MTREVITRFFKKQCALKEAREVANYLNENPRILDEYLDRTEWDTTDPDLSVRGEFRDEIWLGITKKKKEGLVIVWIKRTAFAASMAGLIGLAYYQFAKSDNVKSNALPVVAINQTDKKSRRNPEDTIVINNQKKADHIILRDGSAIELFPGSSIRYTIPFQNNKRELYLEGEAYFAVAKDKNRPFTVFAGGLATTALGTQFRIRAPKNTPGIITVKLFTGKVAIRSIDTGLKGWNENIYLLPGQQMRYDSRKMYVSVEKISVNKIPGSISSKAISDTGDGLNFNGASLPYVVDKLSKYFNTEIRYDTSQLKTMNFTGVVTKNDSLPNVLKAIGQMNDLEVVQKNNGFIIRKNSK